MKNIQLQSADSSQLQDLEGIGPARAERIIQARRDRVLTYEVLAEVTTIPVQQWQSWEQEGRIAPISAASLLVTDMPSTPSLQMEQLPAAQTSLDQVEITFGGSGGALGINPCKAKTPSPKCSSSDGDTSVKTEKSDSSKELSRQAWNVSHNVERRIHGFLMEQQAKEKDFTENMGNYQRETERRLMSQIAEQREDSRRDLERKLEMQLDAQRMMLQVHQEQMLERMGQMMDRMQSARSSSKASSRKSSEKSSSTPHSSRSSTPRRYIDRKLSEIQQYRQLDWNQLSQQDAAGVAVDASLQQRAHHEKTLGTPMDSAARLVPTSCEREKMKFDQDMRRRQQASSTLHQLEQFVPGTVQSPLMFTVDDTAAQESKIVVAHEPAIMIHTPTSAAMVSPPGRDLTFSHITRVIPSDGIYRGPPDHSLIEDDRLDVQATGATGGLQMQRKEVSEGQPMVNVESSSDSLLSLPPQQPSQRALEGSQQGFSEVLRHVKLQEGRPIVRHTSRKKTLDWVNAHSLSLRDSLIPSVPTVTAQLTEGNKAPMRQDSAFRQTTTFAEHCDDYVSDPLGESPELTQKIAETARELARVSMKLDALQAEEGTSHYLTDFRREFHEELTTPMEPQRRSGITARPVEEVTVRGRKDAQQVSSRYPVPSTDFVAGDRKTDDRLRVKQERRSGYPMGNLKMKPEQSSSQQSPHPLSSATNVPLAPHGLREARPKKQKDHGKGKQDRHLKDEGQLKEKRISYEQESPSVSDSSHEDPLKFTAHTSRDARVGSVNLPPESEELSDSLDSEEQQEGKDQPYGRTRSSRSTSQPRSVAKSAGRPPKFNGQIGGWENFEFQFDAYATIQGWDRNDKLQQLPLCLGEKAVSFVRSLPANARQSYNRLIRRLRQRYSDAGRPDIRRQELHDIKQRVDEGLEEFADRVQDLVTLAFEDPDTPIVNTMGAEAFIRGVRDRSCALEAAKTRPTSVQQALAAMKNASSLAKLVLGRSSSSARQVTFHEEPVQIYSTQNRTIPVRQATPPRGVISWQKSVQNTGTQVNLFGTRSPSAPSSPSQQLRPQSPGSPRVRRRPPHDKCFNCLQPGHFRKDCPLMRESSPKAAGRQ
jgi:DNA-binding transcriptional regulator YiaG